MRTRIVPYVPFGAAKAPLPDALETQIVTPLGTLPTASVHYPRQGINAPVLDGLVELGFEYFNGTAWVEPPNCRFLGMRGSFDHLEDTPTRKYSLLGVGWMLRRAKVWDAAGLPVDADGKAQFLSASAGAIMGTLIRNAKARGWGAGISVDFTATADSAGKAWTKVLTIAYDLELDLDTILTNLQQQGVCDFRWEGRTLRIFNPDSALARDLTTGANPVRLVVADGQTSAPEDWTNEDLITHAMVLGEDGQRWEFNNGANTALGRLENAVTQGGVSDPGTAALLAEPDLVAGAQTRMSYTREFILTSASPVWPFRDYQVGDWVLGQRGAGFERLRTHSISLTVNAAGVKGHAVLGDRLEDLLTRLAKRTKGITGGTSAGGSGVRPAPEGPDSRVPAAPEGLTVGVDAYIDRHGLAQGRVVFDWAHSGKATNGTVMDIDRYQVFYRINELGQVWKQLTSTEGTAAQFSPLPIYAEDGVTRAEYGFKVRAVARSNGKASAFSPVVAAAMVDDLTPPPVPQFRQQDLTTWLRTVTVSASGRGANGETMPRDFSRYNVYRMTSPGGFPGTLVATKYGAGAGMLYQSGSLPLETVWFYLTSVDRSGNESAPSEVQSVTPKQLVDLSEITASLDAAETVIQNAGLLRNLWPHDLTNPRWTGDAYAEALARDTGGGRWGGPSVRWTSSGYQTGVYYARDDMNRTDGDLSDLPKVGRGESIRVAAWARAAVAVSYNDLAVYVRFLPVGGDPTTARAIIAGSNEAAPTNQWVQISGTATSPQDGEFDEYYVTLGLFAQRSFSGSVRFSDPEMSLATDGNLIVPNSIYTRHLYVTEDMTAALLRAKKVVAGEIDTNSLAADTAFIGALQAKIITANVFSGKTFTGGTFTGSVFQSHAANDRGLKFNSGGLTAYDDKGRASFSLSAATGSVSVVGRYQSGWNGENRWVIVPMQDSSDGLRAGIWLTNSTSGVGGSETAGMYMDRPNVSYAQPLNLRGMNGGGVTVYGRLNSNDMYSGIIHHADGLYHFQGANGSYFMSSLEMHGRLLLKNTPATTQAANAHIATADGTIFKASSASRFKVDQRVMDVPDALLDVPVKHWIDRGQLELMMDIEYGPQPLTEADQRTLDSLQREQRVPGVVAEEVEAAGGELFVGYTADGRVETVSYDRLALARTAILKKQLDALATRVSALEQGDNNA